LLLALLWASAVVAQEIGPVAPALRERLQLDSFYTKQTDLKGFPILSSARTTDFALREAAWIISRMLAARDDILAAMASNKVRLAVMAATEFTTDIPEHRTLRPQVYWDRRARGLGATRERPAVSCAEENLLEYPGDPYAAENILIHEFAHAIHELGLSAVDPTFDKRLRDAYHSATNRGLWKATYAAENPHEYWAEGTQSWFDDNRENDSLHNHVNTRAELKEYDPALAQLCAEIYGDGPWRYLRPSRRPSAERAHLIGYDRAQAPPFVWREAPLVDRPRVNLQTEFGAIELELDAVHARTTVTNFLRYVLLGLYGDGVFHRTVTMTNQPNNPVKIQVIQASANPAKTNQFLPPIPLERTSATSLRHLDGTISMARDGPDTAQDEFFICIGDQPELDFGGKRNPDGQGFAAFGQVIKGMDVVRRIHDAPAHDQSLSPPIRIQRAIRTR
jgi:cyclophilin family peptidyl-prolyl cis-trans isomerase